MRIYSTDKFIPFSAEKWELSWYRRYRHALHADVIKWKLFPRYWPFVSGIPSQRPVTWGFEVFFDLRLNKRLSKQSRRPWFETPSRSLWRYCNERQWRTPVQPVNTKLATRKLLLCSEGIILKFWSSCLSYSRDVLYIYIYIHMHTHTYIYIYKWIYKWLFNKWYRYTAN